MKKKIRLILDTPRSATLNMAVDEMLMRSQAAGAAPALRFYSWMKPAISLGYFQDLAAVARHFRCAEKKVDAVRRITGGGLVFHGDDLTMSLSVGHPNPFFQTDAKTSYLKVNEALRVGLKEAYPKLDYADCKTVPSGRGKGERVCFEQPACYDLLLEGKKVVGASQRRIGSALLHQSAIFFPEEGRSLSEKILKGFEKQWGVEFELKALGREELDLAARIESERYASPDWSLRT